MDIKGKKIAFLGDSITEGVGVSDISRVYWKLLEERDGCVSYGFGISGSRIAKQYTPSEPRMDKYFATRIPELTEDADMVVVFGGTNDYGHGDAPIGEFSDRDDGTFYGALHNLCQGLMEKYPTGTILFMTPLHRAVEDKYINDYGVRNVGTLKDYVEIIKEVCEYYSIPVLDLYALSGIQPQIEVNRQVYAPDGLHPSDAGNELIYSRLSAFIKNLL